MIPRVTRQRAASYFQGELVLLYEDAHRVAHEVFSAVVHFAGYGGGKYKLEYIINLVFEVSAKASRPPRPARTS